MTGDEAVLLHGREDVIIESQYALDWKELLKFM